MQQSKQNELLIRFGNWIAPRIDRYESILAAAFLILMLLRMSTDLPVNSLLAFVLATLTVLYFLKAYNVSEDSYAGGMERFIDKLSALSLSICTMGILFKLRHFPGSDIMLLVGSATLAIMLPVILVLQSRKPDLRIFTPRMKLRIIAVAAIGFLLLLAPIDDLTRLGIMKNDNIEQTE